MHEQTLLDDLFQQLWRGLDNILDAKDHQEAGVIADAAKDKCRQIMEIAYMLISERDDLLQRVRQIREIAR